MGAEAAGEGIATGRHAASLAAGRPGVLHGNRTYVLCDDDGQITETHSISAGLDYPGVGPEHAFLKDAGRAEYVGITDDEALEAFHLLARTEGILAALESSHAIAQAMKLARELPEGGHRPGQPLRPRRQGRAYHCRTRRHRTVNRIDRRFAALKAAGRTGLIPFVTAGDPSPASVVPLMHALVAAGADVIELGVPFSDPMADGPVIQHASERAIAKGVGLHQVLALRRASSARDDTDTPVVLMGYLNPIEMYGYASFATDAAAAGVDGVLLVDCPIEESGVLAPLRDAGLQPDPAGRADHRPGRAWSGSAGPRRDSCTMCRSPASPARRSSAPARSPGAWRRSGRGPGRRSRSVSAYATPQSAKAIAAFADAVVIGSALVERLAGAETADDAAAKAEAFLAPIRAALDAR